MNRLAATFAAISMGALLVVQGLALARLGEPRRVTTEPQAWEYQVLRLLTEGNSRTGEEAVAYSSIIVDEEQLAALGASGWELSGLYLENETAFPNFGKDEYVTGLRPNVRPQMAVLIFKRPAPPAEGAASGLRP